MAQDDSRPDREDRDHPTPEPDHDLGRKLEDADRDIRIGKLRDQIEAMGGCFGTPEDSPPLDPAIEEIFLQNILAFENAPETTHAKLLLQDGIALPPPDSLPDDKALHDKLWEVIHGLAARRVFLFSTNHLSDRELYARLWSDALNEDTIDLSGCPDAACPLDLLGNGSEEDTLLHLKYYADEEERARWAEDFPGDAMPAHCDPPHDRDRHLPKREL